MQVVAVRADPVCDPDGSKLCAFIDAHQAYVRAKADRRWWMIVSGVALVALPVAHQYGPRVRTLIFLLVLASILRTICAGAVEWRRQRQRRECSDDVILLPDAGRGALGDEARTEPRPSGT